VGGGLGAVRRVRRAARQQGLSRCHRTRSHHAADAKQAPRARRAQHTGGQPARRGAKTALHGPTTAQENRLAAWCSFG
jgi:hypothetical protein